MHYYKYDVEPPNPEVRYSPGAKRVSSYLSLDYQFLKIA